MIRVPCDPAQVIVNHASFRVRLARPITNSALTQTLELATVPRRRAPVVWSGRTQPGGDPAATQLLRAVQRTPTRRADPGPSDDHPGSTQVLPRVRLDPGPPTVVGPRSPYGAEGRPEPGGGRSGVPHGAGSHLPPPDERSYGAGSPGAARGAADDAEPVRTVAPRRHAYYPGRRMNLGVVLLPLRVFLGLISVYAGLGKLSDPVYFDGGARGSMVTWLRSLHPWSCAAPLRDLALAHPVGAGLTVAFLQVVVGVLTVLGLWQRLAAAVGGTLSAALLLTVSWRTVPAYDAPDIIYLAAWSPLIIAGAPVYSVDARLAGEAWRRLGPRAALWELRARVLRRGSAMAAVVVGVTLLFGSIIGGAVRSSDTVTVPGPGGTPTNNLPGSPLPRHSRPRAHRDADGAPGTSGSPSVRRRSAHPSAPARSSPGAARRPHAAGGSTGRPGGASRGGGQLSPQAPRQPQAPPAAGSGPSSSGAGRPHGGSGATGSGGGTPAGGSGGDDGALGGLLG